MPEVTGFTKQNDTLLATLGTSGASNKLLCEASAVPTYNVGMAYVTFSNNLDIYLLLKLKKHI